MSRLLCNREHTVPYDQVMKHVLDNCENIDYISDYGGSAIIKICEYSSPEIIKYLMDKGFNLDQEDEDLWTPIHHVCKRSFPELVKLMVERGVNRECQTGGGWRPIHTLCRYSDEDTIRFMIKKRVNLWAKIREYDGEDRKMTCIDLIKLNDKLTEKSKKNLIRLIVSLTRPKNKGPNTNAANAQKPRYRHKKVNPA